MGVREGALLVGDLVPGRCVGVRVGWEVKGILDGVVVGIAEGCEEGLNIGQ